MQNNLKTLKKIFLQAGYPDSSDLAEALAQMETSDELKTNITKNYLSYNDFIFNIKIPITEFEFIVYDKKDIKNPYHIKRLTQCGVEDWDILDMIVKDLVDMIMEEAENRGNPISMIQLTDYKFLGNYYID